ncbi:MAG TPA: hypothetical protein VGS96_18290 [Thermoanaerobaculia bacterium]|nr:hypothetical protein [Thermoanaerobaculia bacterium]
MTRKIVRCLLAICCVAALPLFAQMTTTTTTTTTTTKTRLRHKTTTSATTKTRVYNDATSLAALLNDAQTTVTVNADVWKTIGNEANSLANRLYGATSGNATARAAATDARTHVREFRKAALTGDAEGARSHANMAMPFVMKLIDWSMPAKT